MLEETYEKREQELYKAINDIHLMIAELPIKMEKYTPISQRCCEAKLLLQTKVKNNVVLHGVSNCTESKTKTCYWCKKRKPTDRTYLLEVIKKREIRVCDDCNYTLDIV